MNLPRQRLLDGAAIRALPRGGALVLATGTKAAMIRLLPWQESPPKAEIAAAAGACRRRSVSLPLSVTELARTSQHKKTQAPMATRSRHLRQGSAVVFVGQGPAHGHPGVLVSGVVATRRGRSRLHAL